MYGMSYGCALLSQLGVKLRENGFNVKSLYLESPYMNQKSFVKKFPTLVENFKLQTGESLAKIKKHSEECLQKINDNSKTKFTAKDAQKCEDYFSKAYLDQNGKPIVNNTDMRCSKRDIQDEYFAKELSLWNSENTKKVFGGNRIMGAFNIDVYSSLQYNTYLDTFDQYVEKLLSDGVTISMTVGNWDIMCNALVTEDWMVKLRYMQDKEFYNTDWTYSPYGKKKDFGQLKYEIIEDSGHVIGLEVPIVPYLKIKELVKQKSINENLRFLSKRV